ncbi:hypothetical protein BFJ63_vAg14379 [Fusarium oxysporum f. sp. narcissi]|uniref:Uncharacterized protein n=1 Tax=Fusarium oxysporum f. sp. narcissi TaxID=451672 RepID=A0A4Q2VEY8_FUSOX|nr:hypothetical protein BFJ63_vAg14379 [Fusarium oxysporum f. sp. narcissi]
MMRHILYLATRLQRDSVNYDENLNEGCEGDEDEPSDCDDEDEDEDDEQDDHGIDEECFKEYNRLETETHSNGNKEHYGMNDGEDESSGYPTFSLSSGLWLHLSEAIFQLSMMFWTYQKPTGNMSASTIIRYTAALGI